MANLRIIVKKFQRYLYVKAATHVLFDGFVGGLSLGNHLQTCYFECPLTYIHNEEDLLCLIIDMICACTITYISLLSALYYNIHNLQILMIEANDNILSN